MTEFNIYSAFGLAITSDVYLPELSKHPNPNAAIERIKITHSDRTSWPALKMSDHSTALVQMSDDDWRLELEGIGWFRVHQGQHIEWQRWDDSVSDRDLRTFLVSAALGAIMIQRGNLMLHATSVVKEGKAVLLLGMPTSGKSTLAFCLQENGWKLLSSEITYVDSNGMVWPGVQQIKLWLDALMELDLNKHNLPLVRRGLKRYSLMPTELEIVNQATPLSTIYDVVRQRKESKNEEVKSDSTISTWQLINQQRVLLLLRNKAYQPRFYRGMQKEEQLFLQAASLAKNFKLYRLLLPDNIQEMKTELNNINLLDPSSLNTVEAKSQTETEVKPETTEDR
tara:strand:+ start:198 stop:1214 length:1017 start_codon:yes stop_codon:yes gene_type:complete